MTGDILLAIVAVLAAIVGYWVIRHKLPLLSSIDVSKLADEQAKAKTRLLEQRFERAATVALAKASARGLQTKKGIKRWLKPWYQKLLDLEKETRPVADKGLTTDEEPLPSSSPTVESLLAEGQAYLATKQWPLAESKFLAVLGHDLQHLGAYEGLGLVYEGAGDDQRAAATWRYLYRLLSILPAGTLEYYGLSKQRLSEKREEIAAKLEP